MTGRLAECAPEFGFDGTKRDMPVISADGIVGKVRDVLGGHTAQVLAINDQTSGAGVLLELPANPMIWNWPALACSSRWA